MSTWSRTVADFGELFDRVVARARYRACAHDEYTAHTQTAVSHIHDTIRALRDHQRAFASTLQHLKKIETGGPILDDAVVRATSYDWSVRMDRIHGHDDCDIAGDR